MQTSVENALPTQRGSDVLSLIIVNAVVDGLEQLHVPVSAPLAAMRESFRADARAAGSRKVFVDELQRACEARPQLALELGASLNDLSFHFIGPLIVNQPTLRDTVATFLRVMALVVGGPRWSHVCDGEDVVLGYRLERELGAGAEREAEIFVTSIQRSLVHWLGALGRDAVVAQFGFAAPRDGARFRALFGQQVRFGDVLTGVRFPAALLDRARPGASLDVMNELRELGDRWMPREEKSWSARMRQQLTSTESLAKLSFDDLAWGWGMSPRSLRRRLSEEDTSFMALLEEARLMRAQQLLASEQHTLLQISVLLGYWEVNSFQRAFKRWVGSTPGSYRRRLRASSRTGS